MRGSGFRRQPMRNYSGVATVRIRIALTAMIACLFAAVAIAQPAVIAGAGDGVTAHELALFLHVFLFVFWLGPDIGVWLWSRQAIAPELIPEQRVTAGRMMQRASLISRVCMSLMLTVGGVLSGFVGLEHPWWQMAGIVLLGPVWLALVLVAYFRDGSLAGATADRLELWLRWLLVVAVPVSVLYSMLTGRLDIAPYVGSKLLLFAAILFLGLQLQSRLRPFRETLEQYTAGENAERHREVLAASVRRGQPYVIGIWILLLVAALLGVIQPGVPEPPFAG